MKEELKKVGLRVTVNLLHFSKFVRFTVILRFIGSTSLVVSKHLIINLSVQILSVYTSRKLLSFLSSSWKKNINACFPADVTVWERNEDKKVRKDWPAWKKYNILQQFQPVGIDPFYSTPLLDSPRPWSLFWSRSQITRQAAGWLFGQMRALGQLTLQFPVGWRGEGFGWWA